MKNPNYTPLTEEKTHQFVLLLIIVTIIMKLLLLLFILLLLLTMFSIEFQTIAMETILTSLKYC